MHPPREHHAKQALRKFRGAFAAKYGPQLETCITEKDYREYETGKEFFDFLDSIIPDEDSIIEGPATSTRGKKRWGLPPSRYLSISCLICFGRRSESTATSEELEDVKPTIEACEQAHEAKYVAPPECLVLL